MNATTKTEGEAIALELEPTDAARRAPVVQQSGAVAIADAGPAGMMLKALSMGASLDQVERMMDLQDRWEKREAEKAFNQALAAFKAEAIEVLKNRTVSFETRDGDTTSYNHAELSGVVEAVGPALAKHGFSFRWDIQQCKGEITVTCILKHAKGHSETVTMTGTPDTSGKKNAIQQTASTVTYLQRYTLKAITGVAEKGQDDDGRGGDESADSATGADTAHRAEPRDTRPVWPEGSFRSQFGRWSKAVAAGLKTPADILAMARSKGALTTEQEAQITNLKSAAQAA